MRRSFCGEVQDHCADILPMDEIVGVEFIHGDFSQETVLGQLTDLLGDAKGRLGPLGQAVKHVRDRRRRSQSIYVSG